MTAVSFLKDSDSPVFTDLQWPFGVHAQRSTRTFHCPHLKCYSSLQHPLPRNTTRVPGCLRSCHHVPNLQAIAQACLFITFLMNHYSFIKPWIQFTSQWHILQLQETKLMDTFSLILGQRLGVSPCCCFYHTAWLCFSAIFPQHLSSPLETGVKYACLYP